MNSAFRMNDNQKGFDFTAMKIFFSVVAILLSMTLPKASAVTENPLFPQSSILEKLAFDFKNQKTESVSAPHRNENQCKFRNLKTSLNQKSNPVFNPDFYCPLQDINKKPNES